jgi:ABC-2 type transport system ATP-binding protein
MPVIEVDHLQKRYGDRLAVADVSLSVGEGEVFCLLGPNWAGKATTTEILEGYRARTGGDVRVLGHDPGRAERALRERIGIVLQECGVPAELSVAELLAMYGRPYPRRRPTAELLALVGLEDQRSMRAGTLSGGQRRRLDLALALVGDPDVVFLDEPTTGFDPTARRDAWSAIRNLCALGKTVFLTTHFMDEAQALADRIAVLRAGRIVAAGTPDDLGGRGELPATIRFAAPAGGELPVRAATEVARDGDHVTLTVPDAADGAHAVTSWARERGLALRDFSVTRPSLEDVYLRLTAGDPDTPDPEEALR